MIVLCRFTAIGFNTCYLKLCKVDWAVRGGYNNLILSAQEKVCVT